MAQTFDVLNAVGKNAGARAAGSREATQLFSRALLGLGMAALWGLAAGAKVPLMAIANVYKVPMVLALSGLVAAQRVAAVLFCALLGGLAFGWWRARERAAADEADLVLEREFLQLEEEQAPAPPGPPGFPRVERRD